MIVSIDGIVDGKFLDKYGKRGVKSSGMPSLSFPINISDYDDKIVKSFAIVFSDPDSVPVCGFEWMHWLCITTKNNLSENASIIDKNLIQGINSWGRFCYGGMAPPDRPHTYVCKVYSLDVVPTLSNGFSCSVISYKLIS